MFQRRLLWAWGLIALMALVQGAVAWWAIDTAARQVERGRVASDILLAFQALKRWPADGLDSAELDRLAARVTAARAIEPGAAGGELTRAREEAITALRAALADGRPLRPLLDDSLVRERAAVADKRRAADDSLRLVRGLALGATLTLALAAALLAVHFSRALRRPLEQLSDGATALQAGDLSHRIPAGGDDEFARLARRVNALAGELQQRRADEASARERLSALVDARTAELQDALTRLQALDARRQRLLADVSHELRTPTTAIRGEAEIALRGGPRATEDYRAALARIVEAAGHLGHVIDDLLAVARSDTDRLGLRPARTDGSAVLRAAIDQARALAAARGVTIDTDGDHEPVVLRADAQRLRQLFMVLLDNAVHYTPAGGRVRISASRPPGLWRVVIDDTGVGIGADELPHVFERRFRGAAARERRPEGSGLGLPLARDIALAHGGSLDLGSAPGAGTRATLTLPPLEDDDDATADR